MKLAYNHRNANGTLNRDALDFNGAIKKIFDSICNASTFVCPDQVQLEMMLVTAKIAEQKTIGAYQPKQLLLKKLAAEGLNNLRMRHRWINQDQFTLMCFEGISEAYLSHLKTQK